MNRDLETLPKQEKDSCEKCKEHAIRQNFTIVLKYTMEELLQKGGALKLHEFYKAINALLNSRGGYVIIHLNLEDPKGSTRIDPLDQKVDDKLRYLLPGNCLYHQVYERYFVDEYHLLYRVRPRPAGTRPYSTLNFNSSFPVNKGLVEPSQDQMKTFIQSIQPNSTPPEARQNIVLSGIEEGEQPLVALGDDEPRPFHEGMSIQAKGFTTENIIEKSWKESKPYIPAFSKLPKGGSVFLGIYEEKKKIEKLGQFLVKAIEGEVAAQIETEIQSRLTRSLKWVGVTEPRDVVTVERLPVEGTTSQVIQVNISFYNGLCFDDPKGPEVYKVTRAMTGKKEIEPVPFSEWLGKYKASTLTEF